MPCDAVAKVQVKVPFSKMLLSKSQAAQLIEHHLKAQGFASVSVRQTEPVLEIQAGALRVLLRNQQLSVTGGRGKENQQLAEKLQQFLSEVAGIQFQQRIQQILSARYQVTQAVSANNKALVMSLNLLT